MGLYNKLLVPPGKKFRLRDRDPTFVDGFTKESAILETVSLHEKLEKLQDVLYAEHKRSLLVVLQAMDAGGKDGTVKHVMSGVNPQGCDITSFKQPTSKELDHDYLWRVHQAAPAKGMIGIFNRSHYEDVLVVRVHNLVPKEVWSKRYDQINSFENLLAENGTTILKFFLHISKDEQRKRFQARIDDADRRWKISPDDFKERKYWDEYTVAYEEALTRCSTSAAPWFVIPANKKWFRNLAVSRIIVETLEGMHMKFPAPTVDVKTLKWK